MAVPSLITHEDTKPASPAMDRLVNEAFRCACSKHCLSRMFFTRPGRWKDLQIVPTMSCSKGRIFLFLQTFLA